jgi:signal peptidase II
MFRFGLLLAALVVVLDQSSKAWMLSLLFDPPRRIELTPFFDLVPVSNRGISFGLFAAGSAWAPWLLAGIALAIGGGLLWWLWRVDSRLTATALALVVGGALGNAIDRVRFGAVIDFLDFHAGALHWPAFNLADSAITVGVLMLLGESLFQHRKSPKPRGE